MNELAPSEFGPLLKRMPAFELSYETMTHKKVLSECQNNEMYDIGLVIPHSKKYILWFTFYEDRDVCILMELNRDKKIVRMQIPSIEFPQELSLGTIFYGSCILETGGITTSFIMEDVLWYKGISLQKLLCNERLAFAGTFFDLWRKRFSESAPSFRICLAYFFRVSEPFDINRVPYDIHHLQYRSFSKVVPYLNLPRPSPMDINPVTKPIMVSQPEEKILMRQVPWRMNLGKPQYKSFTIFEVAADTAFDIYHLYACGKMGSRVYYGVAFINSYKNSVFMNSIFRNIKENRNLDFIEESDDEEEFQNTSEDRFVDLGKRVQMEFLFLPNFKRWIPCRLAPRGSKIVHISML